jgi:hypothetical protein
MQRRRGLIQFKVRGGFGPRGIEQAVFFLWAQTEKQARRTVQEVAPQVDVVEIKPIDKLIAADDVPRPAEVSGDTGPALPRFFSDRP